MSRSLGEVSVQPAACRTGYRGFNVGIPVIGLSELMDLGSPTSSLDMIILMLSTFTTSARSLHCRTACYCSIFVLPQNTTRCPISESTLSLGHAYHLPPIPHSQGKNQEVRPASE